MLYTVFAISLLGCVNAAVPNQASNDDMLPAPQRMDESQMNQLTTDGGNFQGPSLAEVMDEELHAQLHAPGGPSEDEGGRRRMHCNPSHQDWACCSPTKPCANGEGDCDSNADCVSGYCAWNVGKNYGANISTDFDVCEPKNCDPAMLDWSCCSSVSPCAIGEGDCDSDIDCIGTSICIHEVGANYGVTSSFDVCGYRDCSPANEDWNCCSIVSPCAIGEGDCDFDSDCIGTSICIHEVGANYGVTSSFDVCGSRCSPADEDWSCCSSTSPCANGHGDCDSDNECTSGYCSMDVGLTYGVQASFDVCETKPPCYDVQDTSTICDLFAKLGHCSGSYRMYCEHACCLHDLSG